MCVSIAGEVDLPSEENLGLLVYRTLVLLGERLEVDPRLSSGTGPSSVEGEKERLFVSGGRGDFISLGTGHTFLLPSFCPSLPPSFLSLFESCRGPSWTPSKRSSHPTQQTRGRVVLLPQRSSVSPHPTPCTDHPSGDRGTAHRISYLP